MQRAHWVLVTLALTIVLAGCGIPTEDRRRADALDGDIKAVRSEVSAKSGEYEKLTRTPEYEKHRMYAEREKWSESFPAASAKISEAEKVYNDEVKPILKKDEPADTDKLRLATFKASRLLSEAKASANTPSVRLAYINEARAQYPKLITEAGQSIAAANTAFRLIDSLATQAKTTHQARAGDIDKRLGPIQKLYTDSHAAYKVALEERNLADRGRVADFAALADNSAKVKTASNKLQEDATRFKGQLESLSRSYCKTITEMKAKYYITVIRYSWDDDADYPTTHEHRYSAKEIQGELYDYFNGLPASVDKIAVLKRGWSGDSITHYIDQGKWYALGIAPRDSWPSSSDDTGEYYFELSGKYFHKYSEERNGRVSDTDWVEVSDDFFEDHVDNLGMDIECKPLGIFAEEILTTPAPAGMAFVGNPAYGQWKTDPVTGQSFWYWYAQYMIFSHLFGGVGQPYYYRQSEWNHWNSNYRGRQGYYGEDKDKKERYGSGGIVTGTSSRWGGKINDIHRYTARHGESAGRGAPGGHRGGVGGTGK